LEQSVGTPNVAEPFVGDAGCAIRRPQGRALWLVDGLSGFVNNPLAVGV